MARNRYADLVGKGVVLNDAKGPLKPCLACGSTSARIGEGKGPHLASLRCNGCGNHLGWLGHRHLVAARAALGLPAAPDDDFDVIEGAA